MENQVVTRSKCDRCDVVEERNGAEAYHPPVGWADLDLRRRDAGSGWTNNTILFDGALCPACQKIVLAALRQRIAEE